MWKSEQMFDLWPSGEIQLQGFMFSLNIKLIKFFIKEYSNDYLNQNLL